MKGRDYDHISLVEGMAVSVSNTDMSVNREILDVIPALWDIANQIELDELADTREDVYYAWSNLCKHTVGVMALLLVRDSFASNFT